MKLPEPHVAHLWWLPPNHEWMGDLQRFLWLLTPDETAANERIRPPEPRTTHLRTRILIRMLLSDYAPVHPSEWTFTRNEFGRPSILHPLLPDPLEFNIAHSGGLIAVLISRERCAGVDVEHCVDRSSLNDIATHFFAEAEVTGLRNTPPALQSRRFFTYWTLKESYMKARGIGLQLGLSGFWFHVDESPVRIEFSPEMQDNPHEWQFRLIDLMPNYLCAVAMRTSSSQPFAVVVRNAGASEHIQRYTAFA